MSKGRTWIDSAVGRGGLAQYVPILGWIRSYDRKWLVADALAGLSVWALLVPQSLAYATIVGVPVQYGLYSAFAALLVYPLFGTSKHLVVGPSADGGAVLGGRRDAAHWEQPRLVRTRPQRMPLRSRSRSPSSISRSGLLRMGWISTFLSRAVMSGFILGFAIGIVINQAPQVARCPRDRRLVPAAALGIDQGDPRHERRDARSRRMRSLALLLVDALLSLRSYRARSHCRRAGRSSPSSVFRSCR